jgi:hypothetical protein
LHPLETRRLVTAHVVCGPSRFAWLVMPTLSKRSFAA